jgi:hypothetical protein
MSRELVLVDEAIKAELIVWLEQKLAKASIQKTQKKEFTNHLKTLKNESKVSSSLIQEFKQNQMVPVTNSLKARLMAVLNYKLKLNLCEGSPESLNCKGFIQSKQNLEESSTIKRHFIDKLEENEIQMIAYEKEIKAKERRSGKTVATYNYPEEAKEEWVSNYDSLVSNDLYNPEKTATKPIGSTVLTIDNVMRFLKKVELDGIVTQPRVEEAVSYEGGPESSETRVYPYHMFLRTLIFEGISRVRHVIEGLASFSTGGDYNCIVSVGSAMNGKEILVNDPHFQDRFLTRRTAVFIFERDDLKAQRPEDNYLFNYLNIYFKVELGRNITKTTINDVVTIYSFPYKDKGFTIDLVHINSYYIPVYKPFLAPIVSKSIQSMFMESLGNTRFISTFSHDTFIMKFFTYFFICPGSYASKPWENSSFLEQYNFLVNLKELRRRGYEDVYTFITSTLKSKAKIYVDAILTKSEEDPRYKKVIQFVGQPDLWTILEDESVALGSSVALSTNGGRHRRTNRRTRKINRLTRRRFRKN